MTPSEYLILAALLIPLIVLYFRDDAIGATVRVPSSIQRPASHLPIIGGLYGIIMNIDRVNHYIVDEHRRTNWMPYMIGLPFQPPFIAICSVEDVEFMLKTRFENFPKGDFLNSKLNDTLGHIIII